MKTSIRLTLYSILAAASVAGCQAAEPQAGFKSIFNGKDLTGWGFEPTSEADKEAARKWQASDPHAPPWPIVTTPVTFENQTTSSDGRYVANGR